MLFSKSLPAWVACVLLACAAAYGEQAGDEPKIDVIFYFSNKDPYLPDTEKALADAIKLNPRVRIIRISIDTSDGYKKLAADEKAHGIKEPGDFGEMMISFGPYFLNSKGTRRDIEMFFGAMMHRLITEMKGNKEYKARIVPDMNAYAKEVFGANAVATAKAADKADALYYYRVSVDGKAAGWVVDAYHPIECPICSATQFKVAVDAKNVVIDVRPIREIERLATLLPDAETAAFVAQFKGKTVDDLPIKKVDGISRATKTVYAYRTLINEILDDLKRGK